MKPSSTCDRAMPCLAVLAFLGTSPVLMAATKTEESRPPEISYEASSMDADVKTHVMHLKDVTITYGKMTVRADRALATAGDFKNSRWTFDGNVRINAEPRGNLRSDEAVVEFEDNQLKRATATGNPAEFDQKREDSDLIARGHADQIIYEVGSGTVRLSSDAWVTDGRNDIRGPVIVYSLREEHVEATTSPGTDTRVHVTIAPNEGPKADGGGTNKPKAPAPDSGKSQTATPQPSSSPPAAPKPDGSAAASTSPPPQSTPH
jgi:lipopolysaccharide transport protein LptA